jgi:sugar fermentation stimulation protein
MVKLLGEIVRGTFLSRKNQFTGNVSVRGEKVGAHIRSNCVMQEILKPQTEVILFKPDTASASRRTQYDLVAAYKHGNLIHIDSVASTDIVIEGLQNNKIKEFQDYVISDIKKEVGYKTSRFDIFFNTAKKIEDKVKQINMVEVKSVTLEEGGKAKYPDYLDDRPLKQLQLMTTAVEENKYNGYFLFLVKMKGVTGFTLNDRINHEFTSALRKAVSEKKINLLAYDCNVLENEVTLGDPVPIEI